MADKVEPAKIFSVDMTGKSGARLQENVFVKYASSGRRYVDRKQAFSISCWAIES